MRARVPGTPARAWIIEGIVPAGAVVAITDLDDPPPDELIAGGVDVVLRLHDRGEMSDDQPVLLSAHWRPGLWPGEKPPAPIWVRHVAGRGFVPVGEGEAA